jgi:hypothetical protein
MRGWPFFPVKLIFREGRWRKIPLIKDWRSKASSDPVQIAAWRKEFPHAVFGVELDRAGLIVVDADRHGGPDGVAALQALGPLPPHPIIRTPSGGEHHYFRQRDPPIAGRLSWRPGIDLLGVGRFVVAYGNVDGPIPVLPQVFEVEASTHWFPTCR